MEVILNNPYRILGILVGATAKEQDRQLKRLRQFISAGQEPDADYSFPALSKIHVINNQPNIHDNYTNSSSVSTGQSSPDKFNLVQNSENTPSTKTEPFQDHKTKFSNPSDQYYTNGHFTRTLEQLDVALSKMHLENEKMTSALFWFIKDNLITDEAAFECLKDNDINGAKDIWVKLISKGEISKRTFSAFHNLSTLLLLIGFRPGNIDLTGIAAAINLKLKLMESEFVLDVKNLATDATYSGDKKKLQLIFLQTILNEIISNYNFPITEFVQIIIKEKFQAKDDFLQSIVQKQADEIERLINSTKTKRKSKPGKAASAGKQLALEVKNPLLAVREILGRKNFKFISLSDKAADEILQSGIDYFNFHKSKNKNPGKTALTLCKAAKKYAASSLSIQRCNENINLITEWIEDAPLREKMQKVMKEIEQITFLLLAFDAEAKSINNAKKLLESCKNLLAKVKLKLGEDDDFYLRVSTKVAEKALSVCIFELNQLQNQIAAGGSNLFNANLLSSFIVCILNSMQVVNEINKMNLLPEYRTFFNKNKEIITKLESDFCRFNSPVFSNLTSPSPQIKKSEPVKSEPHVTNFRKEPIESHNNNQEKQENKKTPVDEKASNKLCYIATMAYGDYNHPQVIRLRKYRDEHLRTNFAGKLFITFYYIISPRIVRLFNGKVTINLLIRKFLDGLIEKL